MLIPIIIPACYFFYLHSVSYASVTYIKLDQIELLVPIKISKSVCKIYHIRQNIFLNEKKKLNKNKANVYKNKL